MDFDNKKQKILIVDDMPINIQILAEALKSSYRIKIATNGEKALEIAASNDPPDLILLDIVMPEMDGHEVISRLKENTQTRDIPVIFITVKDETEDETVGLELGAADYITKPFKLPVVKARIKTQLELRLAEEERLQKEKLLVLLEMAGTVCHELNQPLQAISGYSQLLRMGIPDDHPKYETVLKIEEQVNRMGMITEKLMHIARYETKNYLHGKIIDLDKAANLEEIPK